MSRVRRQRDSARRAARRRREQSATAFTAEFPGGTETITFAPDDDGPAGWFVTRLGVGKRQ